MFIIQIKTALTIFHKSNVSIEIAFLILAVFVVVYLEYCAMNMSNARENSERNVV